MIISSDTAETTVVIAYGLPCAHFVEFVFRKLPANFRIVGTFYSILVVTSEARADGPEASKVEIVSPL